MRLTQVMAAMMVTFLVTVIAGGFIIASFMVLAAGIAAVWFGIAQIRRYGLNPEYVEPDQFERSARWVGKGQLELEDHEALVHNVLNGGCAIPTRLVDARALATELRQTVQPATGEGEQMALTPAAANGRLPRLPRGYFDGYLSADEPEDATDWAEVRRGDGSSYWIRSR